MKRWIALFLAIFTLLLASCELGGEEQTTTKATETTTKEQTTTVAEETTANPYADCVDLSDYKIIYSTEAKSYEYDCALALQTAIKTASGKTLPIMADDENEGKTRYEIVVGNTNRSALYQLDTTGVNYAGYIVKTEGKRFVVFANDKTGLKAAVEYFASILSVLYECL